MDFRCYTRDMDWKEQLTDEERERLIQIERERASLTAEYRRIYDRCRKRQRRALDAVEFQTPSGHTFIVDRDDAPLITPYRWFSVCHTLKGGQTRTPYVAGNVDGQRVYLHRFLTAAPKGKVVDHLDGDPLNNCRINLRVVSHAENMRSFKLDKAVTGSGERLSM